MTLLIYFLVSCSTAVAQQDSDLVDIRPGDGQIDGRRIAPYTNAWRSYREQPDGMKLPLAIWYDTVSVVTHEGATVLRRVQHIVREDAPSTVLVNEADHRTLLPRRTLAQVGNQDPFIDLQFEGRRVTGRRMLLPHNSTPAGQVPVEFLLELPEPAYDWRWWGLLAVALPLQPDYGARFLAFATEAEIESPLIMITVRVAGEEKIDGIHCWIVEIEAGRPWTLWIAKSRDVAPVQRIRIEQPGGDVLVWESIRK